MPLELIPNQPIVFANPIGDYSCLNNDPTTYAQLVQDGDVTCLQWGLIACDEPLCEPNMIMDPVGINELGSWTTGTGWSSSGFSNLSFDGSGGGGNADQDLTGLVAGAVYRLNLNVSTFTGDKTLDVIWSLSGSQPITQSGQYSFYFIANDDPLDITLSMDPAANAGDTIVIEDISLVQVTDCWLDELPGDLITWSYSYDAGQGKFCSTDTTQGDLINTTAFTTTGNYHGVTMVISDCTAGGVEVRLGSVLLGTTSGNGQFDFYGIPTAGTDLVFTKVDGFDGCISQVNVKDFGDVSTAAVTVRSDNNFYKADGLTPTPFKDRLIQCIDWESLSWNMNGIPGDCIPLRVDIKDPCDNDVIYISINRALYKSGSATWDCTKLVEAWNDGYAFGLYFGDINNPDFKLRQRLRVLQFSPVYRNSGEEYLYSSGASGRSFAQSHKARTAWFDYVDEYAHDCIRTQLLSNKLFVDNYAFFYPVEDYEPEWAENGRYNLAQSRVTLIHEEAIFGSTCGVIGNAVCPPQIVPTPVPAPYTQVNLKQLDPAGTIDFTNFYITSRSIDEDGNIGTATAYGPYDATNAIDRVQIYTDLKSDLDTLYSTSMSGSVTYTSALLINMTGSISLSSPQPVYAIALTDTFGGSFPVPITFQ